MEDLMRLLREAAGEDCIREQESMKKHTTFRIGGPADYFAAPTTAEGICGIVRVCREQNYPYYIIGNGSNLLVPDCGYRGLMLQLYRNFSEIRIEEAGGQPAAGVTKMPDTISGSNTEEVMRSDSQTAAEASAAAPSEIACREIPTAAKPSAAAQTGSQASETVRREGQTAVKPSEPVRSDSQAAAEPAKAAQPAVRVIRAQAGAMLSGIAKRALDASLTGFEFASGIPGTLGGAVVMNAGAYGGELKDILLSAIVLTREGELLEVPAEKLALGYRRSSVAENGWIVLEARLALKPGRQEEIRARMEELKARRIAKQPLDIPSAGSTFKRPEGNFAGKLIMEAGLRGFSVGGAQVSEKHCGFVVNRGNATAEDVLTLIEEIRRRVKEQSGVTLEPEIKIPGGF